MPFIDEIDLLEDCELSPAEFDYAIDLAEFRYAEFEQDGRTLVGTAIRYGDVSTQNQTGGPERMEPGVFGDLTGSDVILDMMHQRTRPIARTGGGGLVLTDGPEALTIAATLPETRDGDDALRMVEAGILRGFSPMFYARRERYEGNTRVISSARMPRIGLVDTPAYDASLVAEIRAAGEGLAGRISVQHRHDNQCQRTDSKRVDSTRCFLLCSQGGGPGNQLDSWQQRAATCQQKGWESGAGRYTGRTEIPGCLVAANVLRCGFLGDASEQDGHPRRHSVILADACQRSTAAFLQRQGGRATGGSTRDRHISPNHQIGTAHGAFGFIQTATRQPWHCLPSPVQVA